MPALSSDRTAASRRMAEVTGGYTMLPAVVRLSGCVAVEDGVAGLCKWVLLAQPYLRVAAPVDIFD